MTNTKTVLSIRKPTPKWATWLFRIVFNLTFCAAIWIGGTNKLSDASKVELMLVLKVVDQFFWGVGRGLGVKNKSFYTSDSK